jgi:(2Fe-2S) ferredoxin
LVGLSKLELLRIIVNYFYRDMSKHKRDLISKFELEGRLLSFVVKDGYKIKYLRLATSDGEYTVKLAKAIRRSLPPTLAGGESVWISGWQTQSRKTGQIKFKAEQIKAEQIKTMGLSLTESLTSQPIVKVPVLTPQKPQACILFCQKSDCCQRGGRAVAEALEEALSDRNLGDRVTLKPTGCMKRCKAGPNIVMPDKTRYSKIRPADLPAILDQHFPIHIEADFPRLSKDDRSVAPIF